MKKFKVAIIGSRSFTDKDLMWNYLDTKKEYIDMIISGNANGADKFGQEYAIKHGIPLMIFAPKWYDEQGNYDRGAGFRRNFQIVKNCDYVLAWHDGVSKGTLNSLEQAERMGKKVKIIKFIPNSKEEILEKE